MTPQDLAALHATCFITPRPWSAAEFADLLVDPQVFLLAESGGFLLARVVADEAEILTLAVAPAGRRQGLGTRLVAAFAASASARGATRAHLEVSAENRVATAIYRAAGFAQAGLRRGYFRTPDGRAVDALVLCRDL